jgi:hypothetical protein
VRTKAVLVELLKGSRELRVFYKQCCHTSAFRLRAQSRQFCDELVEMGYDVPLDDVQNTLFELARDLFPDSPAADFVTWASLLRVSYLGMLWPACRSTTRTSLWRRRTL